MSACSLGGAEFLPVVLGILSELMGSRMLKQYRQVLINYAIPSGKRLIGNGLSEVFQIITMIPSTLLMPVKSYLERKTADKPLTVMDWPPESRPEYNRGSMESPGQRKK